MLATTARRRPSTPALTRSTLSLAGVALACALAPTAASAAGGPPACTPPGGQRTAQVAHAARPDGSSEVTEFTAGGGYRVTRCGRDGRVLVSQTVSPILGPDGAAVLVPTEREERGVTVAMLYGDPNEAAWAAEFRGARAALAAQVIAPTVAPAADPAALPLPEPAADPDDPGSGDGSTRPDRPTRPDAPTRPGDPPRDPSPNELPEGDPRGPQGTSSGRGAQLATAAVAGDACTNPQYAIWETRWGTRDYSYYVNRSRFNYNDTSVASIVSGHRNWDTTYNSCGFNDITNLTSHHLGSTAETIHTYPDGASVTDRGSLASICPGALACTWLFSNASGRTTETDQRYNENYSFSNVGAAGAYDYESISTHETGHSIGLDHANSSNALTMYYQIAAGTTYARSLGKGDVLGMRARYP